MAKSKIFFRWLAAWPHWLALPFTLVATLGFYIVPNPFPWLAPMALAWPVLLLWHLGWTLMAASQLRPSALIGLIILCLTWPQTKGLIHLTTTPMKEGQLRVATWNVHQWRNLTWSEPFVTESRMQQQALDLHADILAIQENRENAGPQRALEANYPYHTTHMDQGLLLFSKYPIQQWNFEPFTASYPGNRGFIWADIQTPLGLVRVVNIHLVTTTFVTREAEVESDTACISASIWNSAWRLTRTAKIRSQQVDQLIDWAGQPEHPPLIWMGDFNDAPTSNTTFRMRAWTDAFEVVGKGFGSSYAGLWGFPLRIDRILMDTSWQPLGMKRTLQEDSDHHPIWVDMARAQDPL